MLQNPGPTFIPTMYLPRLIYWISSVLLSLMLLFSAFMYLFNHEQVKIVFELLGYPGYLIYPLGIFKILAVMAIISSKSRFLKNLAYAGIFYNFSLAFIAHLVKGDGEGFFAFLGLLFLAVSFLFDKILKPRHKIAYDL
jgi:hypothetical protein